MPLPEFHSTLSGETEMQQGSQQPTKSKFTPKNEIPDNVKMMQWFPQTSLLANSNVKVLITHCGLNSAFEAAYFGVPVVAIPISADQFNQSCKTGGVW